MSTIYPPEYQQSPPQPPPLPPHKSWPRRHKILTALASAFGLLVVLIVVIAVTSAPSITKPSTPVAAPAIPAQATPTATPTPTPTLSGPVGTTYQVTDGSGDVMTGTGRGSVYDTEQRLPVRRRSLHSRRSQWDLLR